MIRFFIENKLFTKHSIKMISYLSSYTRVINFDKSCRLILYLSDWLEVKFIDLYDPIYDNLNKWFLDNSILIQIMILKLQMFIRVIDKANKAKFKIFKSP